MFEKLRYKDMNAADEVIADLFLGYMGNADKEKLQQFRDYIFTSVEEEVEKCILMMN